MVSLQVSDLILAGLTAAQLRERVEAQIMRRRFEPFARAAFGARHPTKVLKWTWAHGAICEHLEACKLGQIRRLIINVPPRNLKSHLTSVALPAWWWIDSPATQFLAISADEKIVFRDADALRDLCGGQWYQDAFCPTWSFQVESGGRRQDAKGYYRNTAGGHRISMPIGTKAQGVDADVVIFDDPLDAESAYNDKSALRDHVVHARQKFMTRLNDPETGVIIVIMQRLHELDLSGVLIEEGGWEHLCLPAEMGPERHYTILGDYDKRKELGELLDPVRMSREFLAAAERSLGPRGFAGQYLQRPAAAKGALIHKAWPQYWTPDTLPPMDYVISSWDLTMGSTTGDADYVVGQVWGAAGINRYLLDQLRAKLSTAEMVDAILASLSRWPAIRATVIEEKAAGKDVADTLREHVPGIETYDPQDKSKEQRLAATVLMWRDGTVFLPDPFACSSMDADYSWVRDDYMPELITFPSAAHDDQVDATSQALLWMRETGPVDVRESVKAIG